MFSSIQAIAGLPICASSLTECQTSLKYLNCHLTHVLSLSFLTMSVCKKGLLRVVHTFALSFTSNKFCLRRELLIPSISVCGDWVCWNECLPLLFPYKRYVIGQRFYTRIESVSGWWKWSQTVWLPCPKKSSCLPNKSLSLVWREWEKENFIGN